MMYEPLHACAILCRLPKIQLVPRLVPVEQDANKLRRPSMGDARCGRHMLRILFCSSHTSTGPLSYSRKMVRARVSGAKNKAFRFPEKLRFNGRSSDESHTYVHLDLVFRKTSGYLTLINCVTLDTRTACSMFGIEFLFQAY